MRKLNSLTQNSTDMFGPGTDLIVSLVAVLMIMFALQDTVNFKLVRQNQLKVMKEIAAIYNSIPIPALEQEDTYFIFTDLRKENKIVIQNDATLQRISFGSDILFDSGKAELKDKGKEILIKFSSVFSNGKKLGLIKEIQIQGHADTDPLYNYKGGNLGLAADRAIAVFDQFQSLNINPNAYVISITSFGEHMPVERLREDLGYNSGKLQKHNATEKQKNLNRRIEIVLNYRKRID
jgi:flagellar motor protein MotB